MNLRPFLLILEITENYKEKSDKEIMEIRKICINKIIKESGEKR